VVRKSPISIIDGDLTLFTKDSVLLCEFEKKLQMWRCEFLGSCSVVFNKAKFLKGGKASGERDNSNYGNNRVRFSCNWELLSRVLKEEGFKVVELGPLTPGDEFIKAAQETDADAILISSLYGMADIDLRGFKEKCVEAGLSNVLLYLGGYLKVGRHDWEEDEKHYKEMGFDRVYPSGVDLKIPIADLKADLGKKN
jgi:methylaspartate mutase S subunit